MGKGQPRISHKEKESARKAARKRAPRSSIARAREETAQLELFKDIFDSSPEGKIVCDQEGKILQINTAALNLFELSSERPFLGIDCQQFLRSYKLPDEQQFPTPEPWLLSLILGKDATANSQEEIVLLHLSSGRQVYVDMRCSPLFAHQQRKTGTLVNIRDITHEYHKAFRLQHVHKTLLTLNEAIACIPVALDRSGLTHLWPETEAFLLSPPVLFIAQQLVDLVRDVLEGQKVSLLANVPPAAHIYYIAGSGFTAEQEQYHREIRGRFLPSDFLDESAVARLSANQEVILPTGLLRMPRGYQSAFKHEALLLVPLVFQNQLVGSFLVAKSGHDSEYTAEEVAFVQVVAEQSLLLIECLHYWYGHRANAHGQLAQQEMHRLIGDFLNLASHELKTPLTVIKGNIQLAQRRIEKLKQQIAEQPEYLGENVEHIQQALVSASQSARLQERMINDLIDDARIQAHRFELDMSRADLVEVLRTVVAEQQRLAPDRTIILNSMPAEEEAFVDADVERVKQVVRTYLTNALKYSPADRPVTVQLTVDESTARVSVRDEGPGIPAEDQEHLFERFYRGKGTSVQHELDLSLGLGLYLCKAFIEQHNGSVGVQSNPDRGVTFWFTLPFAHPAGA